ncbi:hypothetical protein ACDX78_15415 [Virgibacillus oceani]
MSDEMIELNFPHHDYKMFATIALESFLELGDPGRKALFQTGKNTYKSEGTLSNDADQQRIIGGRKIDHPGRCRNNDWHVSKIRIQ